MFYGISTQLQIIQLNYQLFFVMCLLNSYLKTFSIFFQIKIVQRTSHNHNHNILRLFDVLPNFSFTTSETMRYYYLSNMYIRVASRVTKRLKTQDLRKLGNIMKVSKLYKMIAQSSCQNENLVNTRKKLLKNSN